MESRNKIELFKSPEFAKAEGKPNPITGQHVELTVQSAPSYDVDKGDLKAYLSDIVPNHMVPKRLRVSSIAVGHRFKRA